MTSECSYQRIEAMRGNRALDNHGRLVFVKFMGGEEVDSRVYVPAKTCALRHESVKVPGFEDAMIDVYETGCGERVFSDYNHCPYCGGKLVAE